MYNRGYQVLTPGHREARRAAAARRTRRLGFIALGVLVVGLVTGAYFLLRPTPPPPRNYSGTVDASGQDRAYDVHLPPSYDGSSEMPVVLVFHGFRQTTEGARLLTGMDGVADAHDFIVVYPAAFLRVWEVENINLHQADDLEFVETLIDQLDEDLAIDRSRIYATGFSNGAMMSYRLACMMPEAFAAFAPVGGALPITLTPECEPTGPVSIMVVNGTADPSVGYGGTINWLEGIPSTVEFWMQHNACSAEPEVEELPDGGDGERTVVRRHTYEDCSPGGNVVLYEIEGGGHQWPGGATIDTDRYGEISSDLNTSEAIWEFFSDHARGN